eukprot:m.43883 g.43883  ORF g.43883 m.43883 type:complete len:82 (-) comp10802_c0_seq1:983-1228(-)
MLFVDCCLSSSLLCPLHISTCKQTHSVSHSPYLCLACSHLTQTATTQRQEQLWFLAAILAQVAPATIIALEIASVQSNQLF